MTYCWDTSGKDLRRVRVGETISYGGGDIPYVDRVVEITPDTPKPDSETIGEIKFLRAALKEREREVERLRDAARLLLATIPYEEAQTEEEAVALKCLGEAARERGEDHEES